MEGKVFHLDQRGGASLIAVALTSTLITVIVLAMTSMMTGELRQATDAESSVKAYYQAESAAEEASAYISNRLSNGITSLADLNQDCLAPTPTQFKASASLAVNITCARVIAGGKLPPLLLHLNNPREQVKEFDLTGLNFDTIDLAWGVPDEGGPGTGDPLLEVTMTNYPPSKTDVGTSISTMILDPTKACTPATADPCPTKPFFYASGAQPEPTANDLNVLVARRFTGLPLRAVLDRGAPNPVLGPGYHSVLRIRTRKNSARFQLKLFQGGINGTEITAIPLNNAVIDITAQVGGAYRRIQREVPVKPNTFPGLSDVIYADTNICKDFYLLTSPGFSQAYSQSCPINP